MRMDEEALYLRKYRDEVSADLYNRAWDFIGDELAMPSLTSLLNYPNFGCYESDGKFVFTYNFFGHPDEEALLSLRDFGRHFRRPQKILLFIPKIYHDHDPYELVLQYLKGTFSEIRCFEYSFFSIGAPPGIVVSEIRNDQPKRKLPRKPPASLILGIPGIEEPFVKQDHVEANALSKRELARLLDLSLDL